MAFFSPSIFSRINQYRGLRAIRIYDTEVAEVVKEN